MDRTSTYDQQPHTRDRDNGQSVTPASPPILAKADAARRMLLLTELQAALATLGVSCVLARNHRLVLQVSRKPCAPSGLTDPKLHIFGPHSTVIAMTDGTTFSLASGQQYPASNPAAAATIRDRQHAGTRT
jgi:hypothetical protein